MPINSSQRPYPPDPPHPSHGFTQIVDPSRGAPPPSRRDERWPLSRLFMALHASFMSFMRCFTKLWELRPSRSCHQDAARQLPRELAGVDEELAIGDHVIDALGVLMRLEEGRL